MTIEPLSGKKPRLEEKEIDDLMALLETLTDADLVPKKGDLLNAQGWLQGLREHLGKTTVSSTLTKIDPRSLMKTDPPLARANSIALGFQTQS